MSGPTVRNRGLLLHAHPRVLRPPGVPQRAATCCGVLWRAMASKLWLVRCGVLSLIISSSCRETYLWPLALCGTLSFVCVRLRPPSPLVV